MDARKAFLQLGFGAKFDFNRFQHDAIQPKVKDPDDVVNERYQLRNENDSIIEDEMKENENVTVNNSQPFRWTKDFIESTEKTAPESLKKRKKKKRSQAVIVKQKKEEAISHFRKQNKIHVWGADIPVPCSTFEDIIRRYNIVGELADTMREQTASWTPTPIQMQSIPIMLEGREILGSAPTGSGKTLAFLIPLLQHLRKPKRGGFRAVIVEPTRELAKQVYREALRLNEKLGLRVHMITNLEVAREKFGPGSKRRKDILVCTPNRLVHLINQDSPIVDLSQVEWLVVDESDKLFEPGRRGFREQLAIIHKACENGRCKRAFFSATFSYEVEQWCKTYLDNVIMVSIGSRNSAVETVKQELVFVGTEYGKLVELRNMVSRGLLPPVLIFVQTKERAQQLHSELLDENLKVDVIHSGRDRKEREKAVKRFRAGKIWLLICTELMGRGIDFKHVNVVINYDFPPSAISYIHRIGRTGRAGRMGRAITFFTERDRPLLRSIANVMKEAGCPTPDYMLQLKKPSQRSRQKLLKQCVERPRVAILRQGKKRNSVQKRKAKNRKIESIDQTQEDHS